MNNYETVFILTPVLSDAQMKEAVDKFTNLQMCIRDRIMSLIKRN